MQSSTTGTDLQKEFLSESWLLRYLHKCETEIARYKEWKEQFKDHDNEYVNRDKEAFLSDCDDGIFAHTLASQLIKIFLEEERDGRP